MLARQQDRDLIVLAAGRIEVRKADGPLRRVGQGAGARLLEVVKQPIIERLRCQ